MAKIIRSETETHKQAFDFFLSLGSRRSYPPVAERFGVSLVSIENWARSFDWQHRVDQAEAVEKKTPPTATEDESGKLTTFMRGVVMAALNGVISAPENGQPGKLKVKIESIADIERIEKVYKRVVLFDEFMSNRRHKKAAAVARLAASEATHG